MKISNHQFEIGAGDNFSYRFETCSNFRSGLKPKQIIIYTTNRPTVQSAVNYYLSGEKSVHLIISDGGDEMVQLVGFDKMAVHAFQFDKSSFALELDYPGYVYDLKKKHYRSRANYDDNEVIETATGSGSKLRSWPLYPKDQLDLLLKASQKLVAAYDLEDILAQTDIFPWTTDPGPAFPMAIFREKSGISKQALALQETTRDMRLRSGPGANYADLLQKPLNKGTQVIVNEGGQGWVRVEVMGEVEGSQWRIGWLDGRFVRAKRYIPVVKDNFLMTEDNRRYQYIKPYENNYDPDRIIKPKYLVMHVTTGTQMESTINWFKSSSAGVSAHLLIGRDGRVIQFVPFDRMAYHCGFGYWERQNDLNRLTIGIELDNAAKLSRKDGGWHKRGTIVNKVKQAKHWKSYTKQAWEDFPQVQLDVAFEIAQRLVEAYDLKDIIGHDRINIKNRMDPGPCFPMNEWRQKIFGREEPAMELFITTKQTPIYEDTNGTVPDIEHPKFQGGLADKSQVRIFETQGKWTLVKVKVASRHRDKTGWVETKYINKLNKITKDKVDFFIKKMGSQAGPPPANAKGSPLQAGTPLRIGVEVDNWTLVFVDDWTWKKAAPGITGPNWTVGWVQSDHIKPMA